MSWAQQKPISKLDAIVALVQLGAILAYVWCRARLGAEEAALAKQDYERSETTANQSELGADSLDGK
jgi:hypothetical protein